MLSPTIGIIPIESVAASIGDKMKRIMIDAIIIVPARITIETLVLRVSWTTAVSELSLETMFYLVAFWILTQVTSSVCVEKANVFCYHAWINIISQADGNAFGHHVEQGSSQTTKPTRDLINELIPKLTTMMMNSCQHRPPTFWYSPFSKTSITKPI